MDWVDIVGLVASLFVLASFLMKDILVVRLINIAGAIIFVVYGIIINAIASWFVNVVLIVVHLVYIVKEFRDKKKLKWVKIIQVKNQ